MSHPKSYTVYRFEEAGGELKRAEVDWKDPKDGQVVVKVLACGVCASDDAVKYQVMPTGLPRVPGHEIVGEIVAIPASEKRWKVGDRVGSGWHGGHCNACNSCAGGDFIMCEKENINGILTDGGYGQYATLRTEAILSIPDDMNPAEVAPLLCAGVTTFNSLRNMNIQPPEIVAVQGIGGLGHLALQFSHAMGFRTIALSSSNAKHDLSLKLGADEYIDTTQENVTQALLARGGAKVIVVTAPSPAVLDSLLPALAVDGTLLLLALMPQKAELSVGAMIQKRTSIRGWPSGTAKDSAACVEFAKSRDVRCMVQTFPLDKAQEAYEHRTSARFRSVIVPNH